MEVDLKRFVSFPDVQKKSPKKKSAAGKKGDESGEVTSVERSFEPMPMGGSHSEALAAHRRALAIHDLSLAQLEALRGLQTELDLNFQSIAASTRKGGKTVSTGRTAAPTFELGMKPYPYGTSKRKAGQTPFAIKGNVPYTVGTTNGEKAWHSKARGDGLHYVNFDAHESEALNVTILDDGEFGSGSRHDLGYISEQLAFADKNAPVLARNLEAHLVNDLSRRNDGLPFEFDERLQTYLRDLRSVLRLVSGIAPPAAKLLESAVKGMLLTFDEELTNLRAKCAAAEAAVRQQQDEETGIRHLKTELEKTVKEKNKFEGQAKEVETRSKQEKEELKTQIEDLKQEIQELSPSGDLDTVSKKMQQLAELLTEMEDEGKQQVTLLQQMGKHTLGMVKSKDEERLTPRMKAGRVVEDKETGDVILRPYDIMHRAVECTEEDLAVVNTELPPRICPLLARRVLSLYSSKVQPVLSWENLDTLIDDVYAAKIPADLAADKAGTPKLPLLEFFIDYHATDPDYGLYSLAEVKLYSVLHLLLSKKFDDIPPKARLFARFLNVCPLEEALPLPVMSAALHAKAQTASPGTPRDGADGIPIAKAYEMALKALPKLGAAGANALFSALAVQGSFPDAGTDDAKRALQCFHCLLLERAKSAKDEGKGILLDMLNRAGLNGGREEVSILDFKSALKDASLPAENDHVWLPSYRDGNRPGQINAEVLGDFVKEAGKAAPEGTVTDTGVMGAIADAYMADFLESFAQLQMELEQHKPSEEDPNRWTYPALKASVQAVCNASDSHVKQLFHTAVEFSRACTQAENTPMPPPAEGASAALKAPSYQAPALGGQLTEHVAVLESDKFTENEEEFARPRKYKPLSYGGDLLPDMVIVLAACQTNVLEAAGENTQGDTPRSAPSAAPEVPDKGKTPPKKKK